MHGLLSYVADNLFSLNAAIQFTGGNFFFIFSNRPLKEKIYNTAFDGFSLLQKERAKKKTIVVNLL